MLRMLDGFRMGSSQGSEFALHSCISIASACVFSSANHNNTAIFNRPPCQCLHYMYADFNNFKHSEFAVHPCISIAHRHVASLPTSNHSDISFACTACICAHAVRKTSMAVTFHDACCKVSSAAQARRSPLATYLPECDEMDSKTARCSTQTKNWPCSQTQARMEPASRPHMTISPR